MRSYPRMSALLGLVLALVPLAVSGEPAAVVRNAKAPTIPVLEFTNTDVRSVFRLLSEYAGVDIVVDPAVSGNVNAVVTNKSWQDVVRIVCKMLDLTATNEMGYLYVQKTEAYQKRLEDKSKATAVMDASAELQRKIVRISNAKASDMNDAVKDLLSARGKITVVERTNSLIIVDGADRIAAIENVLKQLDLETNQVMIEAKLVQVDHQAIQEMGVNWQVNSGAGMGWNTGTSGLGGGTGKLGAAPFKGGQITNNTPTKSDAAQTIAFGLLDGNLGVAISNLLSTNKGEVLASPQITTLDNKEARIFMGDQVPILTKDESNNTVTTYVEAGTELIVTPLITAPDRVLLTLKPRKNNYSYDANAGVIIKKQEALTTVVVSDGETVVIGGLVSKEEIDAETGVPLLKDIPFIGALFRYTRKETIKKDLVIFVTPRIVRRELGVALDPLAVAKRKRELDEAATAPSMNNTPVSIPAAKSAPAPAAAPVVEPQPVVAPVEAVAPAETAVPAPPVVEPVAPPPVPAAPVVEQTQPAPEPGPEVVPVAPDQALPPE